MMKVFLSYSINDSQQYILTILSRILSENNFYVNTPHNVYSIDVEVKSSNLFIGFLTKSGHSNDNVINEWNFAVTNKVPSILLIEDTVPVTQRLSHQNIIYFNTLNPNAAIQKVEKRIKEYNNSVISKGNNENALAWIFGGVAIIALIKLLSEDS